MKIYSNITNFMSKEGISYSDRVVVQVLLSAIRSGYEVVLFAYRNGGYKVVSGQMLAEYYFTKNIEWKNKYLLKQAFSATEIKEEDIYFEVDPLIGEGGSWEDYYLQYEKRNCQMYSYIYFDNGIEEKNGEIKKRVQYQCKYMNKIFVAEELLAESIRESCKKCLAKIEVLELSKFVVNWKEDPFLKIEKGIEKIIEEKNYVVSLFDYEHPKTNRVRMEDIRERYNNEKIVFVADSQANAEKYMKQLEKDKEFGQRIFIVSAVDYYTLLSLYASAKVVIIPATCKSCEFEVMNIQNVKGNSLVL